MDPCSPRFLVVALARQWRLALLVLVAVLAADVFFTATRQPSYLARATLIISPSQDVERSNLVYSVDSLGRGRIVGTYAEVLGSELVQREALVRLGYPAELLNQEIFFRSSSVADAAIIQITVESLNPQTSADLANMVGEIGIARMSELYPLYGLSFLTRATPPLKQYRPDPVRNYAVGAVIGIGLAAVFAYLAHLALLAARRRTIRTVEAGELAELEVGSRADPQSRPVGAADSREL